MRQPFFFTAAAVVAMFAAAPADAADYAKPPVIQQSSLIPDEEVGSGWYLRGDLSYDRSGRPSISLPGTVPVQSWGSTSELSAGVGFGYRFNEWFRSDLTIDYMNRNTGLRAVSDATNTVTASSQGRLSIAPVLLNGYVDFAGFGGFMPYIGAGIGFAAVGTNGSIAADWTGGGANSYSFSRSETVSAAAAAMAGVSYKIGSGLDVDVGYRYLWVKDARSGLGAVVNAGVSSPGRARFENLDFHQFRAGLRYSFF